MFVALYTHQKVKKNKTWQEGRISLNHQGNKATLYDDVGNLLDSSFIHGPLKEGDEIEMDRHLVQISEPVASSSLSKLHIEKDNDHGMDDFKNTINNTSNNNHTFKNNSLSKKPSSSLLSKRGLSSNSKLLHLKPKLNSVEKEFEEDFHTEDLNISPINEIDQVKTTQPISSGRSSIL
jgi:hypothetical protein